jgi:acyl-CoA reductase-like NAD-dependent aldehyde dehydrogenase
VAFSPLSCTQDELFGPILVVSQQPDTAAMVQTVNDRAAREASGAGHSLAMYIFSEDEEEIEGLLRQVRSGGVCVNDCIRQMQNECLPFGGFGNSGFGSYHGIWGFMAFTHERAVLDTGKGAAFNLQARSIML